MLNPLDDRLKNEYSTQYVLVTDKGLFYPDAAYVSQEQKQEKISESAVAGLNYEIGGSSPPTKVDPFRQSIGKFWSYNNNGNLGVKFYDAYTNIIESNLGYILVPLTYQSYGDVFVTSYYEDVSDQWSEFFDTSVYANSINLKRKATRLKIRLASDDLLQNRLSILSLITDISKKNKPKAYSFLGLSAIQGDGPEVTSAKVKLAVFENNQKNANDREDSIKSLNMLIKNEGISINLIEFDEDPVWQEVFDSWNEYLESGGQNAPGDIISSDPGFEFGNYITNIALPAAEAAIEAANKQVADQKDLIDELIAKQAESIAGDESKYGYISFAQQFAQQDPTYNYNSVARKGQLDMSYSGFPLSLSELPEPVQQVYIPELEQFSLEALKIAVKDNQFDSFYDPVANTYSYDTRLMYKDAPFMMQLPMSPKAMALVNTPAKNELFVDITPTYNYYSKYYEEGTKQEAYENLSNETLPFSELEMPLIYEVPLDEDGTAQDSQGDQLLPSKFKFNEFGFKLLNCGYEGDSSSYKNFNIVLDQNSKEFLDKYDSVKTQFPFYVDFEFKADANKDFSTLFNSTGMTNELVRTWINSIFSTKFRGTDQIEPDKDVIIGKEVMGTGDDVYYYDPLDPDPKYREKTTRTALLCEEGIYKINETKDFYKVIPAEGLIYAETLTEAGSVLETVPNYMTREFDLNKWLDGYISSIAGVDGYENWISEIVRPSTNASKTFSDSEDFFTSGDDLEKAVKAVTFLGKYRQLVDGKSRNYYDIMNKELAYSETMFYRVQKVAINKDGSIDDEGYVQNFWLIKPNDKENEASTDIMRYIDTQVKYDQNYEYTVYAYQLVVGTRYGFQFENQSDTDYIGENFQNYSKLVRDSAQAEGFQAKGLPEPIYKGGTTGQNLLFPSANNQSDDRLAIFDVVCEPDVKLIEMPFYKKKVVISDAPPMAPEVDIVPLRGQDNDIKINFYPGSVSRELIPIALSLEDLEKFDNNRKAQDRDLFKQQYAQIQLLELLGAEFLEDIPGYPPSYYVEPRLKFKSDDFVTHYEIYRLDSAPKNYEAFVDNLYEVIDSESQSSYTDTIEQNKKYYYVFRSLDVHGNISNPSPVYQVEMVENSGAVYPVISIYEFEPQKTGSKTKPFKRHLKIDAAAMQGVINLNESGLENASTAQNKLDQVVLGPGGSSDSGKLFSPSTLDSNVRKFKFRVRSKHTGKIVDLNVAFKIRKNKPAEAIDACSD